jgi:hypothetical protein
MYQVAFSSSVSAADIGDGRCPGRRTEIVWISQPISRSCLTSRSK